MIALNQFQTYEGLIEGVPTTKLNKSIINSSIKKANEFWKDKPCLIEPKEELLDIGQDYPFGTPTTIPRIQCAARFRCLTPVQQYDYSELTILWFQDEFALPIDSSVRDEIVNLRWANNAIDYEYY